jgi:integrase
MQFTKIAIDQLKPTNEKVTYRDPTKPNLELRLYKSGLRKFYYRSRNKAYQKDIPLGEHIDDVLPIYDALFNIRHLPPQASEAPLITLFRDNATIYTLKQRFMRDHVMPNLSDDTVTTYHKYINRLITYLEDEKSHLTTQICSMEQAQDSIRDFIELISGYTPITANRMASCFSKMFNFGVDKRLVTHNPAAKIPRNREKARQFYANDEMLRNYSNILLTSQCKKLTLDAMRLILLTGLRTGEIRALTRDMVDFSSERLVLPSEITKNGNPHLIALSQPALDILKEHCEGLIGRCKVFSFGEDALHQATTRMTQRAGQRATPHDLRKTFATQLAMLGIKDTVIANMLNHSVQGVTRKHYNFYSYEQEKRYASERLADKLKSLGF